MLRLTAVSLLFILPVALIWLWPAASKNEADFLAAHWQHPIAPQGEPPANYSALEASLAPQDCAACHPQQYQDWKKSLHSQSMTAGVMWQFRLMGQQASDSCLNCHAPLAEQRALLAREMGWANAPKDPVPDYIPEDLAHQGLSCAGCHVRQHQRFGPKTHSPSSESLPHNGFTEVSEFSDGKFCATCHQFPQDGPRTAGKLREDTWAQWQQSKFAEEGKQCQSCHMPNRKHHWQGIHSSDMVRQALTVESHVADGMLYIALRNSGAGHDFPTYMVPKVDVSIVLHQGDEQMVLAQSMIGWQVDVSLENEAFDSRIAAGDAHQLILPVPILRSEHDSIRVELRVRPREHYERTYLSVLEQKDLLDPQTLQLLQTAYNEAVAAHFSLTLWQQSLSAVLSNKAAP